MRIIRSVRKIAASAAIAALAVSGALIAASKDARAQFICVPGGGASATGINSTACGENASANGAGATAVGDLAQATGADSTAVGSLAGFFADPGNFANTAFGAQAGGVVTGNNNTANGMGSGSGVVGNFNSAVGSGTGTFVTGSGNSAVGANAGRYLNGSNNVAIGNNAGMGVDDANRLAVNNTVAIGNNATARADGAVAIGNGAEATRANQFALGTTGNTYTMAGIASAASRAAQTGPVSLVTSDSSGNLATTSAASLGLASAADLGAVNSRLDDLNNRTSKATTGVAMAFAMAGVPTLMPHEKFAAAMNWGTFQGANGLAFNTAFRISDNVQLNGGVGYGTDERLVGGRVGLRVGW
jgi:hypothetical protein